MKIAVVGLPNKGKSTFFSVLTEQEVAIANYPFTTIDPNQGIGFLVVDCACRYFNVKCNPRTKCVEGKRFVPIIVVDIAGIVKDAHIGKGLGNYFLDRVRDSDAIIQVIDISGGTDLGGNMVKDFSADPLKEIEVFRDEFIAWCYDILNKNSRKIMHEGVDELTRVLSGMNMSKSDVIKMLKVLGYQNGFSCDEQTLRNIASYVFDSKPLMIIANKYDAGRGRENYQRLKTAYPNSVPYIGIAELYAKRLEKSGCLRITDRIEILDWNAGDKNKLSVIEKVFKEIKPSHAILSDFLINQQGFKVVFPVEDEKRLSDKKGNVLPDALLLSPEATVYELAEKIHTELAKKLISAIDVKKGVHVAKDAVLKHGDVIKLIVGK